MNEQEIIEVNTLLHDWMGNKRMQSDGFGHWWKGAVKPEDLKYHSSWDWLIPVVQKIIYDDWATDGESLSLDIQRELSYARIEPVWHTVTVFIQWYNSNLTSQTPESV